MFTGKCTMRRKKVQPIVMIALGILAFLATISAEAASVTVKLRNQVQATPTAGSAIGTNGAKINPAPNGFGLIPRVHPLDPKTTTTWPCPTPVHTPDPKTTTTWPCPTPVHTPDPKTTTTWPCPTPVHTPDPKTTTTWPCPTPVHTPNPVTTQTQAQFEVRWLESNIDLHNRMLKLTIAEAAQTTSTEFKTFSLDLQTSLSQEVAQMQGWLVSWYNINYTSSTKVLPPAQDPFIGASKDLDLIFLTEVVLYEHAEIVSAGFPASLASHTALVAFADGLVTEGKDVLELVEPWQDLLIKIDLENFFNNISHLTPWGG